MVGSVSPSLQQVLAPGDFSAIIIAIRDDRARLIQQRAKDRTIYSVHLPFDRVYVLMAGTRRVTAVSPPTKEWKKAALSLNKTGE